MVYRHRVGYSHESIFLLPAATNATGWGQKRHVFMRIEKSSLWHWVILKRDWKYLCRSQPAGFRGLERVKTLKFQVGVGQNSREQDWKSVWHSTSVLILSVDLLRCRLHKQSIHFYWRGLMSVLNEPFFAFSISESTCKFIMFPYFTHTNIYQGDS